MSFNAIRENKILAKISEFTVFDGRSLNCTCLYISVKCSKDWLRPPSQVIFSPETP